MSRRAYPAYKPSGIEWLGDVPAHWEIRRLKQLCTRSALYGANESADSYASEGVRFLRTTDITDQGKLIGDGVFLPIDAVREYILEDGDILFSRSGTIGRSFLYRKDPHGSCSYAGYLVRFVPGPMLDSSFAFYFSKSKVFECWLGGAVISSTIGNVNGRKFANLRIPCPSYTEQRAIAGFLDRETVRIDALIEKKQQQIELLQEKRTALISHAVTKGLDPDAKMKDSGIEWLGEIPEHWEVKRFKHVLMIRGGQVDPRHSEYSTMVLIAPNHIESKTGRLLTRETVEEQGAISGKYLFQEGDILYSKIRPELAKACIALENGLCSADMYAMVSKAGNESKYLFLILLSDSYTKLAVDESMRVAMPKINREDIGEINWPFPNKLDQKRIVEYIDIHTESIDLLITKIQESILMLREYRITLISAAVTGKIDVREEVSVLQTKRKANIPFQRAVLAAEIVSRLHKEPTFGRVKFQKILYLCEHHLGMNLGGNYRREAAGPFDNALMRSVQSQIEKQKWFHIAKDEARSTFIPLEKAGGHKKYYDNYWSDYQEGLDSLIALLRRIKSEPCEIITTLFAAWNDILIEGMTVTDDAIIRDVRTNWHESKKRFSTDRLKKALQWMREKDLVPRGIGKQTLGVK
jgi:type I restriction enzyme S subunit